MINAKIAGMLVVAFVAGSFVASPELRAYAANTVFSTDIVDGEVKTVDLGSNAVTAAKIKDNEVKAAEIAADAVGASEIKGVSKLIFAQCIPTQEESQRSVTTLNILNVQCPVNGVDNDDHVIASLEFGHPCFVLSGTDPAPSGNIVPIIFQNFCPQTTQIGAASIAMIVYDD